LRAGTWAPRLVGAGGERPRGRNARPGGLFRGWGSAALAGSGRLADSYGQRALMRPLDLLYVGTLPPHHGGTAIAMSQVLAGLAARGHSVRAVAPTTTERLGTGEVFDTAHPELAVHRYVLPVLSTTPDVPNADHARLEGRRIEEIA